MFTVHIRSLSNLLDVDRYLSGDVDPRVDVHITKNNAKIFSTPEKPESRECTFKDSEGTFLCPIAEGSVTFVVQDVDVGGVDFIGKVVWDYGASVKNESGEVTLALVGPEGGTDTDRGSIAIAWSGWMILKGEEEDEKEQQQEEEVIEDAPVPMKTESKQTLIERSGDDKQQEETPAPVKPTPAPPTQQQQKQQQQPQPPHVEYVTKTYLCLCNVPPNLNNLKSLDSFFLAMFGPVISVLPVPEEHRAVLRFKAEPTAMAVLEAWHNGYVLLDTPQVQPRWATVSDARQCDSPRTSYFTNVGLATIRAAIEDAKRKQRVLEEQKQKHATELSEYLTSSGGAVAAPDDRVVCDLRAKIADGAKQVFAALKALVEMQHDLEEATAKTSKAYSTNRTWVNPKLQQQQQQQQQMNTNNHICAS
eukprot:PhM_4_TR15622/c5_g1_i1/m.10570